ncbi:MAG: V-type ATPase subunit [Chloroflexi bacterium]|nr:V-type ATPase subunit [Chloroflexota bacterium]
MLNPRYAFISACLKGEEPKTVTSEHIDKMMAASNLQDALAIIRETDIGSYLEGLPVRTFDDLDQCLWSYLAQRIQYVEAFKFLPKDVLKLSRAYVVKYDVSNVKAALQSIAIGKKASMIPVGIIYNSGLLDELSKAENIDDIIELLTKCKLGDYVPALEQYKGDKGAKSKLLAEARLDGEYYKNMLNMARRIKDGFVLAQAFGLIIDLANLQIAMRAIIEGIGADATEFVIAGGYRITDKAIKELLPLKITDIPARLEDAQYQEIANEVSAHYDKTKSITAVDEIIDKHKFRILKEMLSPRVLSPLVMAWYLILKEVEIRNLRLALKAIVDGVSVQEIKNYLVF